MNGCGYGKFFLGMTLGMTMAPSRREMRLVAHKAAKNVTEAVETLTDAMGM